MVKPITPEEIVAAKAASVPEEVLESFNELIALRWNGHKSVVHTKDVVWRIIGKLPELTERDVYRSGWLDVEDVYRKAGWKVRYDKPGYNESYDAYFEFTK